MATQYFLNLVKKNKIKYIDASTYKKKKKDWCSMMMDQLGTGRSLHTKYQMTVRQILLDSIRL